MKGRIFQLVVLLLITFSQSIQAQVNDGLIAHFKFDNDITDSSNKQWEAALNGGGVDYVTGARTTTGKASHFDGINDWILVTHDGSLNFDVTTESFSISFFYWDDVISGEERILQDRYGDNSSISYGVNLNPGNVAYPNTINAGSWPGYSGEEDTYYLLKSTRPNTTDWHHVAIVYDSILGSSLYLDNVLVDHDNPATASTVNNNNKMMIGAFFGGELDVRNYFSGALDDMGIWNRTLTVDEIGYIYAQGIPEPATLFLLALGGLVLRKRK